MTMKFGIFAFLVCIATAGPALANNSEDVKWVSQCMMDNKEEGKSVDVLKKYCECMNDKMSDSETKTISEWEKTHPKEEKECSDKAGWK